MHKENLHTQLTSLCSFNIPSEYLIPLTERDKAKCLCMVRTFDASETPGASQMRERGWKDIGMQVTSQSHRDYM